MLNPKAPLPAYSIRRHLYHVFNENENPNQIRQLILVSGNIWRSNNSIVDVHEFIVTIGSEGIKGNIRNSMNNELRDKVSATSSLVHMDSWWRF